MRTGSCRGRLSCSADQPRPASRCSHGASCRRRPYMCDDPLLGRSVAAGNHARSSRWHRRPRGRASATFPPARHLTPCGRRSARGNCPALVSNNSAVFDARRLGRRAAAARAERGQHLLVVEINPTHLWAGLSTALRAEGESKAFQRLARKQERPQPGGWGRLCNRPESWAQHRGKAPQSRVFSIMRTVNRGVQWSAGGGLFTSFWGPSGGGMSAAQARI